MWKMRSHTLAHLPFLIEDEKRLLGWSAHKYAFNSMVTHGNHSAFTLLRSIMRTWATRTEDDGDA